jgi:hypothetical protein
MVYLDSAEIRKVLLANRRWGDSASSRIRPGFLGCESHRDLIELARDSSAAHRLACRVNTQVLLDKGTTCQLIPELLWLDGDTIRTWYQLYQEDGIEGLTSFGHEGCSGRLRMEQQEKLTAWIGAMPPRSAIRSVRGLRLNTAPNTRPGRT